MFSVLVVEDDQAIRDMLHMYLVSRQYDVIEAPDGQQALAKLNEIIPDVLILDWMLPDIDGLQLMHEIRENTLYAKLPILMLTAKAEEVDKIKGLDGGADDYMTKPVSLEELDARIRALIRRAQGLNPQQLLQQGAISINPEDKSVTINSEKVKIGGTVYRLLYFFMKNPKRLLSRTQLLDYVWGQTVFVEERTVDVHIMRLRKILKAHGVGDSLKTIRGEGYRFVVDDT